MIDDVKITTRDFLSLGEDEHVATCLSTKLVKMHPGDNSDTITQTEKRICSELKKLAIERGGSGVVGLKFMSSTVDNCLYITGYGTVVKEL